MNKPDALRLAQQLDDELRRTVRVDMLHHYAAAELRRPYAQRDALLEALKTVLPTLERLKFQYADCAYGSNFVQNRADTARKNYKVARAAIKAAEENT